MPICCPVWFPGSTGTSAVGDLILSALTNDRKFFIPLQLFHCWMRIVPAWLHSQPGDCLQGFPRQRNDEDATNHLQGLGGSADTGSIVAHSR